MLRHHCLLLTAKVVVKKPLSDRKAVTMELAFIIALIAIIDMHSAVSETDELTLIGERRVPLHNNM